MNSDKYPMFPPMNREQETECYICKITTTTMMSTHGISVCPDCTRRIVHNHVADLMANET